MNSIFRTQRENGQPKFHTQLNYDSRNGEDFPAGAADENLPANKEDMGSIRGPGRCHIPQGNQAHEPQLEKAHAQQ